jgi:hypothetical protein
MTRPPAANPCGTCPYRQDVPSGVWHPEEYAKLPPYDEETGDQPPNLFACHQQDGRLCAGWVGCHDMGQNLALRFAEHFGQLTAEEVDEVLDYTTEVPLWSSGTEAAAHGMAEVDEPSPKARKKIDQLARRLSLD